MRVSGVEVGGSWYQARIRGARCSRAGSRVLLPADRREGVVDCGGDDDGVAVSIRELRTELVAPGEQVEVPIGISRTDRCDRIAITHGNRTFSSMSDGMASDLPLPSQDDKT